MKTILVDGTNSLLNHVVSPISCRGLEVALDNHNHLITTLPPAPARGASPAPPEFLIPPERLTTVDSKRHRRTLKYPTLPPPSASGIPTTAVLTVVRAWLIRCHLLCRLNLYKTGSK